MTFKPHPSGETGRPVSSRPFRVGDWIVEPRMMRLRRRDPARSDDAVPVGPKVMGVLCCLADRAGRPVTRDELLEAVWPDVTVVEGVLNRAISQLRHIFDDDARSPRYIETIRAAGYRLVAEVAPFEPAGVGGSASAPPEITAAPPRRRPGAILALAVASLAVVALAARISLAPRAPLEQTVLHPLPATAWPGLELDAEISPDGSRVAFAASPSGLGSYDIFVASLGVEDAEPVKIAGDRASERSPAWSPDGREIAFLRALGDGTYRILVVDADGSGEPRSIGMKRGSRPDLTWSPDGRWLAYSELGPGDDAVRVMLRNLETGEVERLTKPEQVQNRDFDPAFSPDGREVAFVRELAGTDRDVWVVAADGNGERRLTGDHSLVAGHSWHPDGKEILFASMRSGDWRLWRTESARQAEPRLVPVGSGKVVRPSLARERERVTYARVFVETEVRRFGAEESGLVEIDRIASTGYNHEAHASKERGRVAFVSSRSGSDEVWIKTPGGEMARRATRMEARWLASPQWSPDERRILFSSSPEGPMNIFVLDVETGDSEPLFEARSDERVPVWSADGQSVLFASDRTGEWEVWRAGLDGRVRGKLTSGGGFLARESDDGERVYFSRRRGGGLWTIPAAGGEPTRVVEELSDCDWGAWDLAGEEIHLLRREDDGLYIARVDRTSGQETGRSLVQGLSPAAPPCDMRTLDVTDDGEVASISFVVRNESDVMWVDLD